jgi:preprotein translocase subunit SecG
MLSVGQRTTLQSADRAPYCRPHMWLSIIIPILLGILVIVCVLLTLVVLMQRPKNEGLGAAFGSGVTENIFGAQTATVLTKATVYLGCTFFAVTLLLTVLTAHQSVNRRVGVLENEVRKAATTATPKPATTAGSPQTSTGTTASATPAASATPEASATPAASAAPAASASPESAPRTSVPASPSPSAASESTPAPAASVSQSPPAPSESPQH